MERSVRRADLSDLQPLLGNILATKSKSKLISPTNALYSFSHCIQPPEEMYWGEKLGQSTKKPFYLARSLTWYQNAANGPTREDFLLCWGRSLNRTDFESSGRRPLLETPFSAFSLCCDGIWTEVYGARKNPVRSVLIL